MSIFAPKNWDLVHHLLLQCMMLWDEMTLSGQNGHNNINKDASGFHIFMYSVIIPRSLVFNVWAKLS